MNPTGGSGSTSLTKSQLIYRVVVTDLERFHDPVGERLEAGLPHVVVRRIVPHWRSLHHLTNYLRATAYRELWSH
jgi:hypothetical protein